MYTDRLKTRACSKAAAPQTARAAQQALVCVLLYAVARQGLQAARHGWEQALQNAQALPEAVRWGGLLAVTVLAAVPSLLWAWHSAGLRARALGLRRPQKTAWQLPVAYVALVCGVVSPLARACGVQLGAATQLPTGRAALVLAFLQLCVASPFVEEMLFRGAVQQLLRPWGTVCAVVVQAMLFAALHSGVAQMAYALIMGLLLGWAAQHSKSLVPGMVLHGVNNGILFATLLATGGA